MINLSIMILMLIMTFMWGAFFQLIFFRRRGFAYETVREKASSLAAPAPLFVISMIVTILMIIVIYVIYLPLIRTRLTLKRDMD